MTKLTALIPVGALATVTLVTSLAACGAFNEANGYNLPDPSHQQTNFGLHWERIATPRNYETLVEACLGQDLIIIGQSTGITVSTYDPNCGATSQVVGVGK